jgi:signal transduction histidine kinase
MSSNSQASTASSIQEPVNSIRRRLWLLLLRAFGLVILLIVLFTLSVTLLFLGLQTNLNPFYKSPISYLLISYFQGRGSWQDVQGLFEEPGSLVLPYLQREWSRTVLLDQNHRILVDRGKINSERIGQVYQNQTGESSDEMVVNGAVIGYIVIERHLLSTPFGLALEIFPPIGAVSLLLGLLTLVIGLLLMRRVVHPLSEVIAAAKAVAEGNLGARVPLHRHRDDLYALSASFNQMADSLQRSDQQRRAMLADVAHELRTPLTILRGRLEGIVDGVYPHDEAQIASTLEEVYMLDRLVDDLRLLTLAEARQLPLESRSINLVELAEKVIATFEPETEELGLTMQFNTSPGDEVMVVGDPQRVEQVIGNLIGNALRYVPEGGVVNARVEHTGNRIEQSDNFIQLFVTDNGPGVQEEELEHLFDRFWRGEKSRCRDSGGAGLGLAISKQLVEAMGGEIGARNVDGGGLEVWFALPAAQQ